MRRVLLLTPLFLATAAVLWSGLKLPPPLWIAKHGLGPGFEPTGEVLPGEGIEIVVTGPGIARIGSAWLAERQDRKGSSTMNGGLSSYFAANLPSRASEGDLSGRISTPPGLGRGTAPSPSVEMPVRWHEFPPGYAAAKTEVTVARFARWTSASTGGGTAAAGPGALPHA